MANPLKLTTLSLSLSISLAAPQPALAQSEWFLMERHGGCMPLEAAGQRRAEFAGITGPDMFIERLRAQGAAVEVNETMMDDKTVVEVTAPALGLAVVFVPPEACG